MNLGDRMKRYEQSSVGQYLVYRCPAILRVDGRAFHSFTRGMENPWDDDLCRLMHQTAAALCDDISTAKFAYVQSDEISILMTDYDSLTTEQWFGGKVQKIVSVAASVVTAAFNQKIVHMVADIPEEHRTEKAKLWYSKLGKAMFDARVFSIPADDAVNYFLLRQQDATRNSVSMLGRSKFSHSQLMGKSGDEIQDMLWKEHGINWNDCPTHRKRGLCLYRVQGTDDFRPRWQVDLEPPIFSQDRDYVGKWLETPDEEDV